MLAAARGRVAGARLTQGSAEAMPFADASFDYVITRYAFHHFRDKDAALREVRRVLRPGGAFRIENIAPELSAGWWLYRCFPEAVAVDQGRFWPVARIAARLAALGLDVTVETRAGGKMSAASIADEAASRVTSELVLIDDAAYAAGLERVKAELAGKAELDGGLTLVAITARWTS
jgi:SAM-dependent methyltransferase